VCSAVFFSAWICCHFDVLLCFDKFCCGLLGCIPLCPVLSSRTCGVFCCVSLFSAWIGFDAVPTLFCRDVFCCVPLCRDVFVEFYSVVFLYCVFFCFILLRCALFCFVLLCSAVLDYSLLYSVLFCSTLFCFVLPSAVLCSALPLNSSSIFYCNSNFIVLSTSCVGFFPYSLDHFCGDGIEN
jgi:hypothetical protein